MSNSRASMITTILLMIVIRILMNNYSDDDTDNDNDNEHDHDHAHDVVMIMLMTCINQENRLLSLVFALHDTVFAQRGLHAAQKWLKTGPCLKVLYRNTYMHRQRGGLLKMPKSIMKAAPWPSGWLPRPRGHAASGNRSCVGRSQRGSDIPGGSYEHESLAKAIIVDACGSMSHDATSLSAAVPSACSRPASGPNAQGAARPGSTRGERQKSTLPSARRRDNIDEVDRFPAESHYVNVVDPDAETREVLVMSGRGRDASCSTGQAGN